MTHVFRNSGLFALTTALLTLVLLLVTRPAPFLFLSARQAPETSIEGFYAVEGQDTSAYRWTSARSSIRFSNPGGPLQLTFILGNPAGRIVPVQLISASYTAHVQVKPEKRYYYLLFPAQPQTSTRLQFLTDAQPEAHGGRLLGFAWYATRVTGNGMPPLNLTLRICLAAIITTLIVWVFGSLLRRIYHQGWSIAQRSVAPLGMLGLTFYYFSTALLHYQEGYLGSADALQYWQLLKVDASFVPTTGLLSDIAVQKLPWLMFNRDSLRDWQLPLWNPFNGSGAPQLANINTGVFSPFSLPFYLLDMKLALLLTAVFKISLLGVCMYVFLRTLRLQRLAAFLGATSFAFSGMSLLWLLFTNTATMLMLPAAMLCLERIIQALRQSRQASPWLYMGLSLSVAFGLVAGQPQIAYFAAFLIGPYALLCLIEIRRLHGTLLALRSGLWLVLSAMLGIGLSAVQLVPFLEYVRQSPALAARAQAGSTATSIPMQAWPLQIFPYALGERQHGFLQRIYSIPQNFNEINSAYIGSLTLLLAGIGLLLCSKDWRMRFFSVAALFWILYMYNLFGLMPFLSHFPGLGSVSAGRSDIIWVFAVSCCAALTTNHILSRCLSRPRRLALSVIASAIMMSLVASYAVEGLLQDHASTVQLLLPALSATVPQHIRWILLTLMLGAGIIALMIMSPHSQVRSVSSLVLIAIIFLQTGFVFKDYPGFTSNPMFYPDTASMRMLRERAGTRNMIMMDEQSIPPNANMVYQLTMPGNYDAIGVQAYDQLYTMLFSSGPKQPVVSVSEKALQLLGIEYLLLPTATQQHLILPERIHDPVVFEPDTVIGPFRSYRYRSSPGRFFVVGQATIARNDEQALALISAADFDPTRTVVLGPESSENDISAPDRPLSSTVTIVHEAAATVRLQVESSRPGYLVFTRTHYPGWKARLNGNRVPVLRANYAFSAIRVPAGISMVEYLFVPDSVYWGIGISLCSAAILLISALYQMVLLYKRHIFLGYSQQRSRQE